MAFDAGAVVAHIKADLTDFKKGIAEAKQEATGFGGHLKQVGSGLADLGKQAAVVTAVVGGGLALFLRESSQEANNFTKAMTTLDIIAGRFGQSGAKAQQTAVELGKSMRIGTGAAAESIQNLLKSGLNLDQASDLIKRFTNEAITGKSANISLAQAVQNLSFAYNTQNSALGNMSGVSENFEDIIKRGRESLIAKGKALGDITDDMAKYEGMINLTNLTLGSAERFTGTLIDKQAQLDQKLMDLKITIGMALNPVLAGMIDLISGSGIIEWVQSLATEIPKFVEALKPLGEWVKEHQEVIKTFLTGLAVGLGALLIIGTITLLIGALMNPITWLIGAVALLYTAWQTNFLGIKDVTTAVWSFLSDLFMNYVMPLIKLVATWVAENWQYIAAVTEGVWLVITGIIQMAWALITTVIKVALAIITGDFTKAWAAIKMGIDNFYKGFTSVLQGMISFIIGWGGGLVHNLVRPFEEAWNRISDFLRKIKDALDFTKRHSPSVIDIVNKGVNEVNRAFRNLDFGGMMSANLSPSFIGGGMSTTVANVAVSLDGAIIGDMASATRFAEKIGDQILKKLDRNIRY